jgi:cytolysin-activating lysine-acyltransferase
MCSVPRYRNLLLAELQHLVLDPLSKDKMVLALPGDPRSDPKIAAVPATIAIWASVSEEVDVRIREQTAAGVFPVRLRPEDWSSGEIVWLLDVIAPSEKLATEVLKSFKQVAKCIAPSFVDTPGVTFSAAFRTRRVTASRF